MAVGTAATAKGSAHTSLKQRVTHLAASGQGKTRKPGRGRRGTVGDSSAGREESLWICPIEDRRGRGSGREGMLEDFTLENYRRLVEYTGKLFETGNAPSSREVATVLERLGTTAEAWQNRLIKLKEGRLSGSNFAASRARLREAANRLGVQKLANLAGCPTR